MIHEWNLSYNVYCWFQSSDGWISRTCVWLPINYDEPLLKLEKTISNKILGPESIVNPLGNATLKRFDWRFDACNADKNYDALLGPPDSPYQKNFTIKDLWFLGHDMLPGYNKDKERLLPPGCCQGLGLASYYYGAGRQAVAATAQLLHRHNITSQKYRLYA